jgi:pyrroloquinoline quinone biosynthesis protein D
MTGTDMTGEAAVPAFPNGTKFRFDRVRDSWVVMAPERIFVPDAHAVEVLRLIDGQRSLGAIIDALAARFDAPRDVLARDVAGLLHGLMDRGAIRL